MSPSPLELPSALPPDCLKGEGPLLLVAAFTGEHFNFETQRIEGDRLFLPGRSDPSMIHVVFTGDRLDPGSIAKTDFQVDGGVPHAAMWFDAHDSRTGLSVRTSVFLVVDPLAPDATPTVEIVGALEADGGNVITTGQVTAIDGIAPTVTVILDTARSTRAVTITVETSESIRTLEPNLSLFVDHDGDRGTPAIPAPLQPPRSTREPGANLWHFRACLRSQTPPQTALCGFPLSRE